MKFLFITHNTSLSGAPKTLLLFLKELVNKGCEFDVITLGEGQLEDDFRSISTRFYKVNNFSKEFNYDLKARISNKLFNKSFDSEFSLFLSQLSLNNYDFIYANTVVSINLGVEIKKKIGKKLLIHIHELYTVIDEFSPNIKEIDYFVDKYIVPSNLNKNCLIQDFLINEDKISVIESVSEIYSSISIHKESTDDFRVLMTGGAYWRKGDDLFLLIAKKVVTVNPLIKFYWIGYSSDERQRVNNSDIRKLNLINNVFFVSEQSDISNWYYNSDIFVLPSREDPFPLSAIEAGLSGLPILCFSEATGIAEYLDDQCVFPYLDVDAISAKILQLYDDPSEMKQIGESNKKVFEQFTAIRQVPKLESVLQSMK